MVQDELHPPALTGKGDLEHPGESQMWWEPNTGVCVPEPAKIPHFQASFIITKLKVFTGTEDNLFPV